MAEKPQPRSPQPLPIRPSPMVNETRKSPRPSADPIDRASEGRVGVDGHKQLTDLQNAVEPGRLDVEAAMCAITQIAAYLQDVVGDSVAAAIAGLVDAEQVGRYAYDDRPEPDGVTERRLREGYKIVRMLVDAYDGETARAWLFGTNTRLDDQAPIEVLGAAIDTAEFTMVVRAARQAAGFET